MQSLFAEVSAWRLRLDRIESGESVDRADLVGALARLLDASQGVRDTIFELEEAANWNGKEELLTLVTRLENAERLRYKQLAEVLQAGTIVHRRERTQAERLELRDNVVAELLAIYQQDQTPDLPGPIAECWLEWAWSLKDGSDELEYLESMLPKMEEFLRQVEAEWWQPAITPNGKEGTLEALSAEIEQDEKNEDAGAKNKENSAKQGAGEDTAVDLDLSGEIETDSQPSHEHSPVVREPEVAETPATVPETDEPETSRALTSSHSGFLPPVTAETVPVASEWSGDASNGEQLLRQLVPFETYRSTHFVGDKGVPVEAPWASAGFRDRLRQFFAENLRVDRLPQLHLAVRAYESLGHSCILDATSVGHAAHLLRSGQVRHGDGLQPLWAKWEEALLSAGSADGVDESGAVPGVKLLAFLHAFSSKRPVSPSTLLGGGDALAFKSAPLREALELFRKRSLTTQSWVEHLRDRLDSNQAGRRENLESRIKAARQQLRTSFQDKRVLRNLETSHCREAWASIMSKIAQDRSNLLLDLSHQWASAPTPEMIERWGVLYERTMNEKEAKYIDRNRMNRAFEELTKEALTLSEMVRVWNSGANAIPTSKDGESAEIAELNLLFDGGALDDCEEELCRMLARAALRGVPAGEVSLDLSLADFAQRPRLLEFIDELPPMHSEDAAVIGVEELSEPVRVVARLLEPARSDWQEGPSLYFSMSRALEEYGRRDLQDRLTAEMEETDRRKLWNERRQQVEMLEEVSVRISKTGADLSEFTNLHADDIRDFGKEMHGMCERLGRRGLELPLVNTWASALATSSSLLLEESVQLLRQRSTGNQSVLDALDREDYALATLPPGQQLQHSIRLRETLYRPMAKQKIADTNALLIEVANSPGASPVEKRASQLADAWLKMNLKNDAQAKKLRAAFLDFVFQARLNRSRLSDCFDIRPIRPLRSALNCEKIRVALADEGVNPSYLSQLADIRSLQVIVPENITVSGIESSTKGVVDDFCIVLAPNVSPTTRADVRQHAKGRLCAVIDDLDLCRLLELRLSTEVAPLLGLMEIAFEQQRWERLDPYQTQDGQHVRMEMFVGRMEEGERLAQTNDYKKLFSGRKLGKSALLRYVQDRFDMKDLPSGNQLRVVYLSIVDHFNPNDFIACLLAGIEKTCDWKYSRSSRKNGDAWPLLRDAIRDLLEDRPRLSLLIVLDEADKFVAAELESYLHNYEECLSFKLRTELEQATDSRQLPRIRFLFAGYRETNRSEGAWSNWGATLRLSPLDTVDATSLLAGPLARLGIDLGQMAATMAYRCGFQPAVLLRAGKALLQRMSAQRPLDSWEYIKVRREDVTAVLEDYSIRDEIRTVIDNNFTQNKLGQIVFHAAAILLAEKPFGYALTSPADQIMTKLLNNDPKGELKARLRTDERSVSASILVQLEELQQRKLMVEESGPPAAYRLAFPHHVSALGGPQQLLLRLQSEIHNLPAGSFDSTSHGPLSFFAADEITRCRQDLKEYGEVAKANRIVRALIASCHWLDPVERNPALHPSCGIQALLGGRGKLSASTAEQAEAQIEQSEQLLVLAGGADLIRWALAQTSDEFYIGHASVRRFGKEELRNWFSKLYEIEVSNQQLEEMRSLTGGIPYLVGELHRLILPEATEPPDKLQDGHWSTVREKFAAKLPSIARELREGSPAVQLTEREIEILRMVALAEYAATSDQLVRDLTEGWEQYERPDLKPLGPEDEASVMLLQDLGLLPMQRAFGVRPIDALQPLEPSDPIHSLMLHLPA